MIIADIMTPHARTCAADKTLDRAARLMWEHDCGALPMSDTRGHVIGMVTDRDICMAAYTQGRPLHQIPVTVAGSVSIHSVAPTASVALACQVMKVHRVRRLPVIDLGGNLLGVVSLADFARRAHEHDVDLDVDQVVSALAEVYRPCRPKPAVSVAGPVVKVDQMMTRDVRACGPQDSLSWAARIMWEGDCGCVPVVDCDGNAIAMITDRDICMAAYTRGQALCDMVVSSAASRRLIGMREKDAPATAEERMREYKVRRLPVLDMNGKLIGILSMNDLVRRACSGNGRSGISAEDVVKTLAAVCEPPMQSAVP